MEILFFGLKALIVVVVVAIVIAALLIAVLTLVKVLNAEASERNGNLKITDLKERYLEQKQEMLEALKESNPDPKVSEAKLSRKQKKAMAQSEREQMQKAVQHASDTGLFCPKNLYVLEFNGDAEASAHKRLTKEIDAVLKTAKSGDEVLLILTSPGGTVNGYGLCASELTRFKMRGIRLVICVDAVAASGGYMMACVADWLVAAPFAYIGSIGVIAQLPNFNRLLKNYDVDYEQVTAGRYKRTITMFGENSDEARAKLKEELEAIHERFKEQVLSNRPKLDLDKVATGEHWLAKDALELGLIDEIAVSSEYLEKRILRTFGSALKVTHKPYVKKGLKEKLQKLFSMNDLVKTLVNTVIDEVQKRFDRQQIR